MVPERFSRQAIRFVGTPVEWKARLAYLLGVPLGDVEAWADGRLAVPEVVAARLRMEDAADVAPSPARDEWIRGTGLALSNRPQRQYLVHTLEPRFIGRIVELADDDPAADGAALLPLDGSHWLADVVWIDPEPVIGRMGPLLERAADALARGAQAADAVMADARPRTGGSGSDRW